MSFMNSFKIKLDPFHRQRLRLIDEFDYSRVMKKVSTDMGGLPKGYLQTGIENLKRYYAVALLDPRNRHAVSRPVDPFWHAHVLFTHDYFRFNQEVFGAYIHHQPLDVDDTAMVKHVATLYDYTLRCYASIFKTVDPDWWPTSDLAAFSPVCLHMELINDEILKNALYPEKPQLRRGEPQH